jgi:signal transduction histidine kinase
MASNLPSIEADQTQLDRMLNILLTNAIKFTKQGQIILRVVPASIQKEDFHRRDGIQFSVIDTGIGVAKANTSRVFEKFYQVDSSITREFRGSGLGLSICKAIVEAHHGRIWLESESNQGAAFHVVLPLSQQRDESPEVEA